MLARAYSVETSGNCGLSDCCARAWNAGKRAKMTLSLLLKDYYLKQQRERFFFRSGNHWRVSLPRVLDPDLDSFLNRDTLNTISRTFSLRTPSSSLTRARHRTEIKNSGTGLSKTCCLMGPRTSKCVFSALMAARNRAWTGIPWPMLQSGLLSNSKSH